MRIFPEKLPIKAISRKIIESTGLDQPTEPELMLLTHSCMTSLKRTVIRKIKKLIRSQTKNHMTVFATILQTGTLFGSILRESIDN
jgi:DNA-binding transcriptional regulator YiaG